VGLVREAKEIRAREDFWDLDEIAERYEEVARLLREIGLERPWEAATAQEKREVVGELVEDVVLFVGHLEGPDRRLPRICPGGGVLTLGKRCDLRACAARLCCAPGRIRTCDLRIRSPLLYPLSYRRRLEA
jgi:hypothetical protein